MKIIVFGPTGGTGRQIVVQALTARSRNPGAIEARPRLTVATFGAGDTRPHVGWLARTLLSGLVLRSEVADKEAMELELSATNLEWTVVRVGLLTDGPARGAWRAADDGSMRGMGQVARADVAAFMLAQPVDDTWLRRRPVVMGLRQRPSIPRRRHPAPPKVYAVIDGYAASLKGKPMVAV